jgi:hypothetical protein
LRHAYGVPHLTSSEVTVLVAVVTGGVGFMSARWTQRYQVKVAAEATRLRTVEEAASAADDLLRGVKLFWSTRGSFAWFRGVATGGKAAAEKGELLVADSPLSVKQQLGLLVVQTALAFAPGGVIEQALDKDASYFQGMVVPAQQRLTAAVSSLRAGPDKRLADAADQLVKAGMDLAGEASSVKRRFQRAERAFERRLDEFRRVAAPPRKRGLIRTGRRGRLPPRNTRRP